jgi:hypothetical protein
MKFFHGGNPVWNGNKSPGVSYYKEYDFSKALSCLRWMKRAAPRLDKSLKKIEREMDKIDERLEPRGDRSGSDSNIKFGDIKLKENIAIEEKELVSELEKRRKLLLSLVSKYGKGTLETELRRIVDLKNDIVNFAVRDTPEVEVAERMMKDFAEKNPKRFEELKAHFDFELAKVKNEDESLLKWLLSTELLLKKILNYDEEVGRMLTA